MVFNAAKCLVIVIYARPAGENTSLKQIRHRYAQLLQDRPVVVKGVAIPVGNEHKYLGMIFHDTLSLKPAVEEIAVNVKRAVDVCRLFIASGNRDIPLHLRVLVARAKIWTGLVLQ